MNKKVSPKIIGLIERRGGKKIITFSPSQQKILNKHLENLEGYVTMEVKKRSERRTIDQNALYWFWITCLEAHTGQPKEDIHDYYKHKLLKRWVTAPNGKRAEVVGSTANMTKEEFCEYLETFRNCVAEDWEYILPETYPSN